MRRPASSSRSHAVRIEKVRPRNVETSPMATARPASGDAALATSSYVPEVIPEELARKRPGTRRAARLVGDRRRRAGAARDAGRPPRVVGAGGWRRRGTSSLEPPGPAGRRAARPGHQPQGRGRRQPLQGVAVRAGVGGVRVMVPEGADYEVRRELFRAGRRGGLDRLDKLARQAGFLRSPRRYGDEPRSCGRGRGTKGTRRPTIPRWTVT